MSTWSLEIDLHSSPEGGAVSLLIGAQRFQLSRRLMASSTSEVWIGKTEGSETRVLARAIDPSTIAPGALIRLRHESGLLSEVGHEHLVPLIASGEAEGMFWLVSEFVAGPSLLETLRSQQRLGVEQSLRICRDLFAAMSELHRRGILHSAMQPRFLLLGSAGDSGQLVWPGSIENLNSKANAPEDLLELARYGSPEQNQVLHGEVGETSDIYSAGALLYHCLAGRPPYDAENLNQLLWLQSTRPVPRLQQLGIKVPRALDELLQRALAREPHARYQSAAAAMHDLETILQSVVAGESELDIAIGTRDFRSSLAPPAFVARQAELKLLDEQIERAHAGMTRLAVVEGQSGYGKSRLLFEFAVRSTQAGLTVFEGQGERDVHSPMALFNGIIAGVTAACQLRPEFASQIRERLGDQLEAVLATLPGLASIYQQTTGATSKATEFTESQRLTALAAFLRALGSKDQPAVVILDDSQWAHDLVYRLLLRWQVEQDQCPLGERHLQLVVAYRSEEVSASHPFRRLVPGMQIEVGPLANADIRRLVESMAGPLPLPAVETIHRLAQGSPFMASAILHGLVESRALVFQSQTWQVDPLALETVRSSSHAAEFLSQRLSLLEPDTLQFLQAGALLGAEFSLEMAVHLTGLSTAQAWNAVNQARRRQLLWWSRNDGACNFVHDRIRASLQDLQSNEERSRFHRRAAEYLQVHAPDRHAELAVHLDSAGQPEQALPHAIKAAQEGRRQHALELSEQQFRIAQRAAVAAPADIQFTIAEGLGDILMLRGYYADAEEQFQQAEHLAVSDDAKAEVHCRKGELLIKRGDMHSALNQFELGLRTVGVSVPEGRLMTGLRLGWEVLIQGLHTIFRRWLVHRLQRVPTRSERLVLRLYSGYSHASWYCSKLSLLMWAHLRGMNRAENFLPSPELAQLYSDHAPGMTLVPWHNRGLKYAKRSLAIRRELGDHWGQGQSLHFYGIVQYAAGRYSECIDACRQAIQILQRTGDYWQVHIARYQVAASLYHLGDLQGAIEEARRNHESGLLVGDEQASGIILDVWARALPGRVPESILAEELARERHDFQGAAQVRLAAGIQRISQGRLTEAQEHLEAAEAIISKSGVRNQYTTPIAVWMTTVLRQLAEADCSVHPAARDALLRRAERSARKAAFESRWCRNDLPRLYRERALLAVMRGRLRPARRYFQRSLRIAEQTGARYEFALTLTEQARVGLEVGWAEAEQQAIEARRQLTDLAAIDRGGDESQAEQTRVSVSLIDRFDTLLKTGRGIVAALSRETICRRLEDAAVRLLRAECAIVIQLDGEAELPAQLDAEAAELLERVGQSGQVQTLSGPTGTKSSSSTLCAPIHVRGNIIACLYVIHGNLSGLFGPDEEKIADFLATLAGAAFENAEGFAELERLNSTLEEKVSERTNRLRERAELLVRSNRDLERTTADLQVAQRDLVASTLAAEAANQAKSRFLAAISHEIRTPMNGVIGMAELALATELTDRQQMYVSTISQSAKSLLAMLNDILDFSKIEAGKLELESRPFNLHETIVDSVRLLSVSAWQKGLDLKCEISPHVPECVEGDSTRLRQVLLNLIGNAIKFTTNGSVRVTAEIDAEERLQIEIHDTGIGIPSDRLNRIFQAFDQGEASVTRRFGGTGLGLAITSELTTLMHGSISVESQAGAGSTFRVIVPLNTPRESTGDRDNRSHYESTQQTILVVSRSQSTRDSYLAWLQSWGMDAIAAGSPAEAKLALPQSGPLDLLLIDITGTTTDDLDLVEDLRAAAMLPRRGALILLPTGADDSVERVHQQGLGAAVMKPVTPGELRENLDSIGMDRRSPVHFAAAVAGETNGRLRVLVADDSPINLEVAGGLLELMGHSVATAECGQSALDRLQSEAFDAVLMDVEMPNMDGLTATRDWRAQEAGRSGRVKIFAMSAHIEDDIRSECLAAGMDGFLSKPVDPHEIRTALDGVAHELAVDAIPGL